MPRREWSFLLPAEDHHFVKRILTYYQSRLTSWGQVLSGIFLISLSISSVGTHISAYLLFSFLTALFLSSFLLSLWFRPKIEATRFLPPYSTAGEPCAYKVLIKNNGKRPLRNLAIFEKTLPYGLYADKDHPSFKNTIDWLDPGQEKTVTLAFRELKRGIFRISNLWVGSSFPSGLLRAVRSAGRAEKLIVYPRLINKTDWFLSYHRIFQPGGISLSSKVGDSNEFASTRDYRQGDRLRDVHWASSARSGKLIIKEYIEEYFVRVGLFLDTELTRFEKHLCFETRISLCAGLAQQLNSKDFVVDLFLSTSHYQNLQVGRGVDDFNHLLETLSTIEGDDKIFFDEALLRIERQAPHLSLIVLFLKDWDMSRRDFIQKIKEHNIQTEIIIIRDKPTTIKIDNDEASVFHPKKII